MFVILFSVIAINLIYTISQNTLTHAMTLPTYLAFITFMHHSLIFYIV